jgi:AmmeMemoRadiSam system protein B
VAGRFYPADGAALRRLVDELLDAVPGTGAAEVLAAGFVVPHAGYRYSGSTAAQAYARLRVVAPRIRRVILLGPAHYLPVRGGVLPAAAGWGTPLGVSPIDVDAVAGLVRAGCARADDGPFAPEHSLEVQLPFLQRLRPEPIPVLPMLVGSSTVDEVVRLISTAVELTGPGTVLICSSDLSHYRDEATANAQDAGTVRAVLELAPDRIGERDACGVFGLRGLVGYARQAGLRPALLHRSTSAQATGETDRVVGYAAVVFG